MPLTLSPFVHPWSLLRNANGETWSNGVEKHSGRKMEMKRRITKGLFAIEDFDIYLVDGFFS